MLQVWNVFPLQCTYKLPCQWGQIGLLWWQYPPQKAQLLHLHHLRISVGSLHHLQKLIQCHITSFSITTVCVCSNTDVKHRLTDISDKHQMLPDDCKQIKVRKDCVIMYRETQKLLNHIGNSYISLL